MRHVLVVEDDAHNATLFRKILEKRAGAQVTITEDPAEVLELVRSGNLALVLLDVSLRCSYWQGQLVGGVEICRLIRAQSPRHIPVLLATAHAMRGDAERLLAESGADGYVSKPIMDYAAFATRVTGMMERAA
jgi:two-component system cell cycle response regulator DivK